MRILVPVDLGPATDKVIEMTEAQAKAFGASVELLHVTVPEPDFVGYGPGPQHERDQVACDMKESRRKLTALKERLIEAGIEVSERMYQGVPEEKILEEAKRSDIDLIIMGLARHSFFYRMWVGSVGEELYRQAPCPLLFVPAPEDAEG
ncbi:universal stress protein [Oceanidesulfovibrio marinus]|uniref:Universal stress protein n=1 Tax=Oceanidesulfovibrio marinus TaxID=370038 RepID=A0ABX6NH18_9BACT|nr:universal stress protein [Oceanidesulfovibrio marinus]QJT09904.1 universal stress protein [Oceanidesulfovibrio marinus]